MAFKKWDEIKTNRRTEEELAEITHEAAVELIRYRLGELRQKLEITQNQLSELSGMTQPQISKLESNTDALLSTLQRYANAMGGRLEVNVVVEEERYEIAMPNAESGAGNPH